MKGGREEERCHECAVLPVCGRSWEYSAAWQGLKHRFGRYIAFGPVCGRKARKEITRGVYVAGNCRVNRGRGLSPGSTRAPLPVCYISAELSGQGLDIFDNRFKLPSC